MSFTVLQCVNKDIILNTIIFMQTKHETLLVISIIDSYCA